MAIIKITEIVSISQEGLKKAMIEGVSTGNKEIGDIQSAQVTDIKAIVKNGEIINWEIKMILDYIEK